MAGPVRSGDAARTVWAENLAKGRAARRSKSVMTSRPNIPHEETKEPEQGNPEVTVADSEDISEQQASTETGHPNAAQFDSSDGQPTGNQLDPAQQAATEASKPSEEAAPESHQPMATTRGKKAKVQMPAPPSATNTRAFQKRKGAALAEAQGSNKRASVEPQTANSDVILKCKSALESKTRLRKCEWVTIPTPNRLDCHDTEEAGLHLRRAVHSQVR